VENVFCNYFWNARGY